MRNLEKNEPNIQENPDYGGSYGGEESGEKPGIRGEKIVGEFMRDAFGDIFRKIEQTSQFDQNDTKGVDYIMEAESKKGNGVKFAVDITFDKDERLEMKKKRTIMNPCVDIHDEDGRTTEEKLPRLLIHGGNMGFWFMHEDEAKRRGGGPLVSFMPKNEKVKKQKDILKQIMTQLYGLSRESSTYKSKIQPIKKTFEEEAQKLGVTW